MSNKKYARYFLIAGVLLVWGIVIYRVVMGLDHSSNVPAKLKSNMFQFNYSFKKDSFELIGDYPDPFLGEIDTISVSDSLELFKEPADAAKFISSSSDHSNKKEEPLGIKYLGMIYNASNHKKAGIVNLRNTETIVTEGQKVDDFLIRKIRKGEIFIIYNTKPYTITQEPNR